MRKWKVYTDDGREFDVDAYDTSSARAKVSIATNGRANIISIKEVY